MARVHDEIVIKTELRPCLVGGRRCLFHKWVTGYHPRANHLVDDDGEDYCEVMICETTMGLVEHSDGSISTENAEFIQFVDSEAQFNGAWGNQR